MFKGIPWAKPDPPRRRPFLGITDVENFSGIAEGHTKLHGPPRGGGAPGNTEQVPILAAQYSPNFHKIKKKTTAKRTSSNQTWNSCPYHPLFLVKWWWHRCNLYNALVILLWCQNFLHPLTKLYPNQIDHFTSHCLQNLGKNSCQNGACKEKTYPIFHECPIFYSTVVDLM